jgi:outer membrane lipoprotein-sorting protein
LSEKSDKLSLRRKIRFGNPENSSSSSFFNPVFHHRAGQFPAYGPEQSSTLGHFFARSAPSPDRAGLPDFLAINSMDAKGATSEWAKEAWEYDMIKSAYQKFSPGSRMKKSSTNSNNPSSSRRILFSNKRRLSIQIGFLLLLSLGGIPKLLLVARAENRVFEAAQKMENSYQQIKSYSSAVEQIYFANKEKDERYFFAYYFKKPNKIRVDFLHPHSGLSVFYRKGEEEALIRPFPSLPLLKFRVSIENSLLKTPTGQRLNQTDMEYFIGFLFRNLAAVPQKDHQFQEEKDQVCFLFWAKDYVQGGEPEKYRIFLSRRNWFPVRIERYSPQGAPIEFSTIQNYVFNRPLSNSLFSP